MQFLATLAMATAIVMARAGPSGNTTEADGAYASAMKVPADFRPWTTGPEGPTLTRVNKTAESGQAGAAGAKLRRSAPVLRDPHSPCPAQFSGPPEVTPNSCRAYGASRFQTCSANGDCMHVEERCPLHERLACIQSECPPPIYIYIYNSTPHAGFMRSSLWRPCSCLHPEPFRAIPPPVSPRRAVLPIWGQTGPAQPQHRHHVRSN